MERCVIFFTLLAIAQSKLIELSCRDIKTFVDGHNYKRQMLAKGEIYNQPAANEMKYMAWDQELADKAAAWASRHKFAHNPDNKIPSNRFKTGENLYSYSTTDQSYSLNPSMAMDAWFEEYKDYTYGPLLQSHFDGSSDKQIGHYTQMAWSDSTRVGCAISQKFENEWKKFIVVCNYGPGGNFLGRTPYRAGQPAGALRCENGNCERPYGRCAA